jgi:PadR family transcriptional regulator PadR
MTVVGEEFDNWTVQLRKGVLELCILTAIGSEERYGYALVRMLIEDENLGLSEGTVYPLLSRLRKQGLVTTRLEESPEGPARKYYRLTPAGRARLAAMRSCFADIVMAWQKLDSKK